MSGTQEPVSRWTTLGDPLMAPVLADLTDTYVALYGPGAREEMTRHSPAAFAPPGGGVLLLVENGAAVAAGAFRARGAGLRGAPGEDRPGTGEFKRMWTAPSQRRRGLARRVLRELEDGARGAGYTSVYVSTGWRQDGAIALYLSAGYRPLFDPDGDPAVPFERGFVRDLGPGAAEPGR